jgi:hypothetical protein
MSIQKKDVQSFRDEMMKALEPVLEKFGYELTKSNATYSDTFIKYALTVAESNKSENGVNMSGEYADAYKQIGHMYGLVPDLLGKEFVTNGRKMAFAGIASKRSKYPLAAIEVSSGKQFFLQDTTAIKEKLNGRPLIAMVTEK